MNPILEQAAQMSDQVHRWRRHLHQHPELSFQEYETTAFIERQLRQWGITVERPTATGVVGIIGGSGRSDDWTRARTIALRADIDALPIDEENDLPFRSTRRGVMHACGHDGHTAILLGVAQILAMNRDNFPGRVKLLFQPAEELPPAGRFNLLRRA